MDIFKNLLGPSTGATPSKGLLGDPQSQMMLGLSLLNAGGPSLTPKSGFEGVPQTMALLQRQQMLKQEQEQRAQERERLLKQQEAQSAAVSKLGIDPNLPGNLQAAMWKQANTTQKPMAVSGVGIFDPRTNQYIMPPAQQNASGLSPEGEKEYQKAKGKDMAGAEAARQANIDGSLSFLTKVGRADQVMQGMTDNDFGPVQGSDAYRFVPDISFITGVRGTDMAAQDRYKGLMSDLELDVAKMKLKGQGQVTESERKIARDTLGGLTVADKKTARDVLQTTAKEAKATIVDALQKGEITVEDLVKRGIDPRKLIEEVQSEATTRLNGSEDPLGIR